MKMKVRLQPVALAPKSKDISQLPVLEVETWIKGPHKPRDVERLKELPEEDVSIEKLAKNYSFLEILPSQKVEKVGDIDKLPRDVSAYIISGVFGLVFDFGLVAEIAKLGKVILPLWDNWGYGWEGRFIREATEEGEGVCFVPFGAQDIKNILYVLRAYAFIRGMRTLYIGDIPSNSVKDANYDFADLEKRFGMQFIHLGFEDLSKAIKEAGDDESEKIANLWKKNAEILDGREERLIRYAKTYIALKSLLSEYEANALTVDCAFLPDVELVPCYAFGVLADEGIPAGCEGDTSALLTMSMLMGLSGKSALMGNLFSNTTHNDIENNVIVINHDVVPPSMGDGKIKLRDFHASKMGLTGFTKLKKGKEVTVSGMDRKTKRLWYSKGEIVWTEDTTHCRTSIGIKVKNAKRIGREGFGHHQSIAYGNFSDKIEMLSKILKIEAIDLG
jgi:hypothetical protein